MERSGSLRTIVFTAAAGSSLPPGIPENLIVNSDDPVVFNTNVENELAYIYYTAEAQGEAKSEVLEWVDKIRQYGLDASFIQNEKSAEQILAEIQRILWEIDKTEI